MHWFLELNTPASRSRPIYSKISLTAMSTDRSCLILRVLALVQLTTFRIISGVIKSLMGALTHFYTSFSCKPCWAIRLSNNIAGTWLSSIFH